MPVTAVTPVEFERNLIAAIIGMTPSLELGQAHGWRHDDRKGDTAGMLLRSFRIGWGITRIVVGGTTGDGGYEVESEIRIITDYRALPKTRLGELIISDHLDLTELFLEGLDPTIVGNLGNEDGASNDWRFVDEEEQQRIEHDFLIRWYRRRRAAA